MSLFIGIDSGTQSVKAVVLDLDAAKVVAEARASHRLIPGLPIGHMEQHPAEWTAAMDTVILDVTRKVERARIRGIGVSGQQHGFVPLDTNGDRRLCQEGRCPGRRSPDAPPTGRRRRPEAPGAEPRPDRGRRSAPSWRGRRGRWDRPARRRCRAAWRGWR